MKTYQKISMDDIIFEGRNKQYGAYELRRNIDKNVSIGLLVTVSAFAALLLIYTLNPFRTTKVQVQPLGEVDIHTTDLIIPKQEVIKPIPVVHVATVPPPAILANREYIPVADHTASTTPIHTQDELVGKPVGAEDISGTGTNNPLPKVPNAPIGTATEIAEPAVANTIITYAEVMPGYIGGKDALMEYLRKNIHPFSSDIENGLTGKVIIRFYIDTDGTVRQPEVLKDNVGGRCAEAAIAAIKNMPKWNAGKQNGKPVKVYFTVPVTFDFSR